MTARSLFGFVSQRFFWAVAVTVIFALALAPMSCSRVPDLKDGTGNGDDQALTSPRELLEAANESLRKRSSGTPPLESTDAQETIQHLNEHFKALREHTYAQEAIQHLNDYFKALEISESSRDKPKEKLAVDSAELASLAKSFPLDEEDAKEARSPVFTEMDASYLGLCCQMNDIVQSLDLHGLNALDRARVVFDWVVRQICLKERCRQQRSALVDGAPFAARSVLLNGYGTALERALVFLALIRQAGVAGCMIGVPQEQGGGRLWIPGILVDREETSLTEGKVAPGIYLFDTRLGMPLPGPNGKGIARLDEVMAAPEAWRGQVLKSVAESMVPDQVAKAQIFLTFPLPSLLPRMRLLEQTLTGEGKLALSADPEALRARFQKCTKASIRLLQGLGDPRNPSEELRVVAQNRFSARPFWIWRASYPLQLDPVLYGELDKPIMERYVAWVHLPRALLGQGRSDEATRVLGVAQQRRENLQMSYLSYLREMKDKPKLDLRHRMDEWCKALREAKGQLNEAQDPGNNPNPLGGKEQAEDASKHLADLTSAKKSPEMHGILYSVSNDLIAGESTFLMCLCLQDKAEQWQNRLEKLAPIVLASGQGKQDLATTQQSTNDAWANAVDRWSTFFAGEHSMTVQTFKSRWAKVQSFAMLGRKVPAKGEIAPALYEQLALDLNRAAAARLFQSRSLEKVGQHAAAIDVLEQQVLVLDTLAKSGLLDTFRKYPGSLRAVQEGAVAYSSPDNVPWMQSALSLQLKRLKKKD